MGDDTHGTRTFPCEARSIAAARTLIRDACRAAGVSDSTTETACLIVSELAANAVEHAGTEFTVDVRAGSDGIELRVRDLTPDRMPILRRRSGADPGHLGLQIFAQLVDHWGVEVERDAKTVWCRLGCGTDSDWTPD